VHHEVLDGVRPGQAMFRVVMPTRATISTWPPSPAKITRSAAENDSFVSLSAAQSVIDQNAVGRCGR
jgi:hypothetical protein